MTTQAPKADRENDNAALADRHLRFAAARNRIVVFLCLLIAAYSRSSADPAPYGLASRPAFAAFNGGTLPTNAPTFSGNWSAVPAFPNLTFLNPMGLVQMPGTNKLVVWEREGRIYQFDKATSVSSKTLMLDLSNRCQGWDDSGLMNIAFHPDFATNRYLFVYYTYVTPGTVQGDANNRPPTFIPCRDRLSRFTCDANGVAIAGTETVFIDQVSESVWHNGGGMFFHPVSGFLYLTDGDDANGGNNQRIDYSLHSGVLRIDVDQRGGAISHPIPRQPQPAGSVTQNYFIPNDNPFVGQAGVLEEFFCIGLRSPHRMTHDAASGRTFIGDVGAGSREEIDVIEPGESGLNFQWDRIEGLGGDLTPPYIGVNRRPIIDYTHGEGGAVIGGHVYRGTEFATDLGGKYIFGDNISNTVWYLDETTIPPSKVAICTLPKGPGPNSGNDYTGLSSFGVDDAGELYMCQLSSTGGKIFKFSRSGPPGSQLPATLSQTGVFSNLTTLTPTAGFLPYDVNSPLWSDGAHKQRWFAIPTTGTIGYAPTGEWTFPDGSVFLKHFELAVDDSNPAIRKRLETRILVRDDLGHVYGASYRWRADNSDADLVTTGTTVDIAIAGAAPRTQPWYFPGRQDCLSCHTNASGGVLGLNTPQSHRDFTFPSAITDNQLRAWNHAGYFAPALDESSLPGLQRLYALDDATASIEVRVRSYLDSNCSHCHRPGGVPAFWDARIETPLASAGIINGLVQNTLGVQGAKVVAPRNLARSMMHTRLSTATETYKMPPLAKNLVDQNAVALLEQWIAAIDVPPVEPPPPPWVVTDVGNVSVPTDATFSAGVFSLVASGNDIWDQADGFGFVHRALNGDGEIVAHVGSLEAPDGWTKTGVMIRETLDPGSTHAMMVITGNQGAAFQRRTTTNGGSAHDGIGGISAPYWVKLRRSGDVFTGFISPDGEVWTELATETISMAQSVRVGLCLTAHNNTATALSNLDNVTFSQTSVQIALTNPLNGSVYSPASNILLAATASSVSGAIVKVEFFNGGTKLGESTTAPYRLALQAAPAGTYTFTARATDATGASSTSPSSTISVSNRQLDGLVGEYYASQTLSGAPILRADATLDFDWGEGAPMAGIPADNFSIRWLGRVLPEFTETYTFTTESDDGIRLWVNGQLLVDSWLDQSPTLHSGSIALVAGQPAGVVVEYYENAGGAVARLSWASASQPAQIVPAARILPPNHQPDPPLPIDPSFDGATTNPIRIQMESTPFSDSDSGDTHAGTEWEIWTISPVARVWRTTANSGARLIHAQLSDGSFEGTHAGRTSLIDGTAYRLLVRHRDNSGDVATDWSDWSQRTFTARLPWNAWRTAIFSPSELADASVSGDLADADKDGIVNLLEYALGGNPTDAAGSPLPRQSIIDGKLALAFTRIPTNDDITITVQAADDLGGPWTDLTSSVNGAAMTPLLSGVGVIETGSGATRNVEVRDLYFTTDPAHPSRFLRVEVRH